MADGVAINLDHVGLNAADGECVAARNSKVEVWQAMHVGFRADDAGIAAQGGQGLHMIVVVVGEQDVSQGPAARIKGSLNRRCLWRVDQRGLPCRSVVNQECVVIIQARDGDQFNGHGKFAFLW